MVAEAAPRLWSEMTSPEIEQAQEEGAIVLLPVGAIEQHGPHLPVDVDIHGAWETSKEVARRREYTLVAPPVWWGLSGTHRGFAGTMVLRPETFHALLQDICNSLIDQGFRKVALIVGHGSNKPMVSVLVNHFMETRGVRLLQLNYINFAGETFRKIRRSPVGGDAHAGELETSLQMYLRPGRIHPERAPVHLVEPKRDLGLSAAMQDIFQPGRASIGYDLKRAFPEGVMGDPTVATEETGKRAFDAIVDEICDVLDEYQQI